MTSHRDPWVNWIDFPVTMPGEYFGATYQKRSKCNEVERQGPLPFLIQLFGFPLFTASPPPKGPAPSCAFLQRSLISCLATETFLLYPPSPVPSPLVCCWSPPISSVPMNPGPRRHVPLVSGIALLVHVWTFCPLWRGITPWVSLAEISLTCQIFA